MMENIKKTTLYQEHKNLNAKMAPFAGFLMPVQYKNIIEEHNNVRGSVGIFDVSHMGEFFISGKDSLNAIQKLIPKDISNLADGKVVYSQLLNEKGGIVDDLLIYKLKENDYLLIVNASRLQEDYEHIQKNTKDFNIVFEDKSQEYSMIAIQGPKAIALIKEIYDIPDRFYLQKIKEGYISRTGYTGEDGVELIIKNKYAVKLWNEIINKGEKYNILPIGLGARDTLRLEASLPLYGNDLTSDTTPIDAGLSWSVSQKKETDYIGKETILNQINKNTCQKSLIGFKMLDRAIARHGYEIIYNDEIIGKVTSGAVAPSLGTNIGMGYINSTAPVKIDSEINIMIRNKLYKAKIVKRPFYKKIKE